MMKAPHPSTPPVRERGRVGAFGVGGKPRSVETLNGVVIKALYRQRKAEPKRGGGQRSRKDWTVRGLLSTRHQPHFSTGVYMHHAIVEIWLLGSAEKTIEKPLSALRYGDTTR